MGKSCWMASLAYHVVVPMYHGKPSLFRLLSNFIFQCYRHQTWQFYSVLFISGIHKVPGLKFKGG